MKGKHIRKIQKHESCARKIMSDVYGTEYTPLKSFEEAKKYDDAYLIMEGDWGGQIYLSIPVKQVKCDYSVLESLLKEIDKREWKSNEGDGRGIYFERMKEGSEIAGGMGGGLALEGLWVHNDILEISDKIFEVFKGNKKSILE